MRKLVFVEGVSGVGKSTTAKKLRDALRTRGYSATCHLEEEPGNPVDLFCCAYLTKVQFSQLLQDFKNDVDKLLKNSIQESDYVLVRYSDRNSPYFAPPLLDILKALEGFYKPQNPIPLKQYTQVFADCWRRFLRQDQTRRDYEIFDGSFLYHRANDLIQNYNATNEMIATHLESLLLAMSPFQPLLFYLSSKDVGERLIPARESRGQSMPTDAQIAFWIERKNRQVQVLELLPIKASILDISDGGWTNAIDAMIRVITAESR